jgi:hypothetical protein
MRRIDWRNSAIGALLSLVLDAVVPVGVIQDALRFVARTLGHLFGGGGAARELPGGPPLEV